jgi:hypothetical protein
LLGEIFFEFFDAVVIGRTKIIPIRFQTRLEKAAVTTEDGSPAGWLEPFVAIRMGTPPQGRPFAATTVFVRMSGMVVKITRIVRPVRTFIVRAIRIVHGLSPSLVSGQGENPMQCR